MSELKQYDPTRLAQEAHDEMVESGTLIPSPQTKWVALQTAEAAEGALYIEKPLGIVSIYADTIDLLKVHPRGSQFALDKNGNPQHLMGALIVNCADKIVSGQERAYS